MPRVVLEVEEIPTQKLFIFLAELMTSVAIEQFGYFIRCTEREREIPHTLFCTDSTDGGWWEAHTSFVRMADVWLLTIVTATILVSVYAVERGIK